jgi:hypothetical protein
LSQVGNGRGEAVEEFVDGHGRSGERRGLAFDSVVGCLRVEVVAVEQEGVRMQRLDRERLTGVAREVLEVERDYDLSVGGYGSGKYMAVLGRSGTVRAGTGIYR